MKDRRIISIDIETTGTDPDTCQIIEFAAVIETIGSKTPVEELPTFHTYVVDDIYSGEATAISMHGEIFKRIATREQGFSYRNTLSTTITFSGFLQDQGVRLNQDGLIHIKVAGKNFMGFDMRFLRRIEGWNRMIKVSHRAFDPAILFFDPSRDDRLPDTATCLLRAGIPQGPVHTATEDARNVIKMLRYAWRKSIGP